MSAEQILQEVSADAEKLVAESTKRGEVNSAAHFFRGIEILPEAEKAVR